MPENTSPSSYSKVLYASDLVTIGHFHLPGNSPDFHTAGAISRPTLVFPRTQMWIEKQHQRRYLSHPNLINFYDGSEEYVRYQPKQNHDICDWFEFSPTVIHQALSTVISDGEVALAGNADIEPLNICPLISTAGLYLKQRTLINGLFYGKVSEETAQITSLEMLNEVLGQLFKNESKDSVPLAKRLRYQDIAARAEQFIVANLNQNFALEEIARVLNISPFHLCRIFKLINGVSILDFKLHIKLRLSLDDLALSSDIAELALDHGFASHSHYSTKFKRIFGCTPRQFRQQITL